MRSGWTRRAPAAVALLAATAYGGRALASDRALSPPNAPAQPAGTPSGSAAPPVSGAARAAPTAQEKAIAEGLFQDGRKLLDAGQITEACAKFAESQRLDPSAGTLLNLAVCHEKIGKSASAWAEFKEAASMDAATGKQDRASFANQRAADLEARLSRLVLDITDPAPGMVIRLNDKELDAVAAAGSSMPVDPGEYTVVATAPGKRTWSGRVMIGPGPSLHHMAIPALVDAPTAPPPNLMPQEPAAAQGQEGPIDVRTLGFVVGGLGIMGLSVGSLFGLMTFSKAGETEDPCSGTPDECYARKKAAYDDGSTSATISNVAFGTGIVLLGAGAVLVLTSGSSEKPGSKQGLWISPEVASTGAQMTMGGRW